MQRHRWAIDVIWFFHAHLCPVGPRVLDTCSLTIRTIHIREALWTTLSQSLIPSYFLGPQSSLGLYYYPVLIPCFTSLFKIVHGAPVLFWIVTHFRCIDKPSHTFGFPVVYRRPHKPWVCSGAGQLRCG